MAEVIAKALAGDRNDFANLLRAAYPAALIAACADSDSVEGADDATRVLRELNGALLAASDRERKKFGSTNTFVRWPRFEVLELLANETVGLYGYRVHFSNGSYSEFSRPPDRFTEALNIHFEQDGQVNYFCGSIDDLRKEWRVGQKRLFEVGLPGRYNEPGVWKPLIYDGPTDAFLAEIQSLTDDSDVHGVLFYIYTTAHWVIEFAVRASVDLPIEHALGFGPPDHPLRLWKLPEENQTSENERIYDGWITLAEPTPEAIRRGLAHIRIGMSRLDRYEPSCFCIRCQRALVP